MTLTAAGLQKTQAMSPRVEIREYTGSTNADLVAASADAATWPHLSVLLTDDQRTGRGRLNRDWVAPAGSALACSVLLRVADVPLAARGWIPLIAGAALHRAISAQLGSETVELKWPNDILVNGQKICGILAEATIHDAVIVGFGVNTAMTADELPVPTATSFAVLGAQCDIDLLVSDVLSAIERMLTDLAEAGGDAVASGVHGVVASVCGTIGRTVRVSMPDGSTLIGTAEALGPDGHIAVRDGAGTLVAVSAGDVVHVRAA